MQGPGSFGVVAYIAVITGAPGQGLFVYNGVPATGNLIASIAVFRTTDGHGNQVEAGIVSYVGGTTTGSLFVQMQAGRVNFGSHDVNSLLQNDGAVLGSDSTVSNPTQPGTSIFSPNSNPTGGQVPNISQVVCLGSNPAGLKPRVMLFAGNNGNAIPVASVADVEVRGTLAVTPIGVGTTAFTVQVATDTNPRYTMDDTGQMAWGPGNAATDVIFGRPNTVGFLRVTGGLQVTNLLELFNQPVGTTVFELVVNTEANARFAMINTGEMEWGNGGSSAVDTTLTHVGTGQMSLAASSASGTYLFSVVQSATSVGGLAITMASAGDFASAIYVSGDTTAAPRVVMTGLSDIRFGPGGSAAPDAIIARTGVAILNVTSNLSVNNGKAGNVFAVGTGPSDFAGTVYLEDSTAPATPGTASALYSKSGKLHYVSEDGNDYNVGAKRVTGNPVQTISTTSFTAITGATVTVPAQKCRIKFKVWYASSASSGAPQFQATFPTTTATPSSSIADFRQTGATGTVRASNSSAAISSYTPGLGPVFAGAGVNSLFEMEIDATFASQGTLTLLALTNTSGDPYIVETFYIDVLPEN